ncbi:efflux RND transporter permease subunit [Verrucomicrobiota bacterium]
MTPDIEHKGPIAWMARNPVAANLLMVLFLLGGLLNMREIKQEVFPSFDLDVVRVSVAYPGASPAEVEQGILLAVEDSVRGQDGVKRVTSSAGEGAGVITAELLDGTDSNLALQDIKNAVDRITTLPDDAERPVVSLVVARREVVSLILHGDVDEHVLHGLAELARDELSQDPDITLVEIGGVRPLEISVEVPQRNLRAYGLTLDGIAGELAAAAVEVPAGGVKTAGGEILLRTTERRDFGREYLDIPVVSTPDGTKVLLRDVAEVLDGYQDVDASTSFNGRRAVKLGVYRVGDENPIDVSRAVHRYAEKLEARLPTTVEVAAVADRSEIYRDRLRLLLRNAGIGLVLVMTILGLFLEVRLAFWVMLGIPISFLGSLLVLPYFDVSINMVSLFAFIIAVGIVVDDAIVVGESIYYVRQRGTGFVRAAIDGTHTVATPVVFSIATNIVAFLPLMFVAGTMGQIWRNVPIVIVAVFVISLVEALFILPAHLAHQKPVGRTGIWKLLEYPQQHMGRGLERFVERRYVPFVGAALRRRYLTVSLGLAVLLVVVGYVVGGRLPFTFFPKVESDVIRAGAVLSYGVPFEQTEAVRDRLVRSAQDVLSEHGGEDILRGILAEAGSTSPGFGPMAGAVSKGSHLTTVTVFLVPSKQRKISAAEFTRLWREHAGAIPGLESLSFKFTIGPSSERPIDVQMSHPDSRTLEDIATTVAEALGRFEGVVEIDDGIARGKPQWDFRVKPAARSLGITAADLARRVRSSFYGAEVRRQQRGRNELRIYVRLPEAERRTELDVEKLIVHTPHGGEIPLGEAAVYTKGRAYEEIRRVDGRRVIDVTADVADKSVTPGEVLAELDDTTMRELSDGYPNLTHSFEGERRQQRESLGSLRRSFALALVALFALLAIPFKSYIQAVIIMVAIPFGIVGAVAGHVIMGYGLSVVSMMGMVALAGVVINDNILLISAANQNRQLGQTAAEAAQSAPARRFRPVLLTSLTTFFGLAPMIFETSVQARFLIPMALSLGFGILFSTAITLILTPCLYLIAEDAKRFFGSGFRAADEVEELGAGCRAVVETPEDG